MDYKKQLESLLNDLNAAGVSRGEIEQKYEYAENYLDQALSNKANKKIVAAVAFYKEFILLQKSISGDLILADPAAMEKIRFTANVLANKIEGLNATVEEIQEFLLKLQGLKDKSSNKVEQKPADSAQEAKSKLVRKRGTRKR